MKKNTIIQFIATGMFLFGATACTGNFEDYNKNPHEPDQNDMGVDWYLVRSLALNLQDLMMPEQRELFSICRLFDGRSIFGICSRLQFGYRLVWSLRNL